MIWLSFEKWSSAHGGMGPRGPRVRPHDVDDFKYILRGFGIDYLDFDQEIPDILAGG